MSAALEVFQDQLDPLLSVFLQNCQAWPWERDAESVPIHPGQCQLGDGALERHWVWLSWLLILLGPITCLTLPFCSHLLNALVELLQITDP